MEDFLADSLNQTFTTKNIRSIWENRDSKEDIIGLDTDLPIRFKLNQEGSRNIEIMFQSKFGLFYKTIALVENDNIIFPREFENADFNFGNFTKKRFNNEINVLIGAFSMTSLQLALKNSDVPEYEANGGKYELVRAFDGTMQVFVNNQKSISIDSVLDNLTSDFYKSSLDSHPLSAFKLSGSKQGVFPTNFTHQHVENLVPKRLLEAFTIEQ